MAYCGVLDGLFEINGNPVDLSRLDEGIIIAGDEEIDADEFIGEEEKLEFFNETALRTKDALLKDIDKLINEINQDREMENDHSPAFFDQYIALVERFRASVEDKVFPEQLEEWWRYEYEIFESGVTLMLKHIGYLSIGSDDIYDEDIDTVFNLMQIKAKLLTVEQYAQIYKVTPTTVRQWIRRGKIRSAIKKGSEWRIPEIAEVMSRGYRMGHYDRKDILTDLPEGYEFFNDYDYVSIRQNSENKGLYDLSFHKNVDYKKVPEEEWNNYQKDIQLSQKEREKFELYLIGNPFVEAFESCLTFRG